MSKQFPSNFTWGVATASYQVEGAFDVNGRTPSIWDTFSRQPGKVIHAHTGDVACDQFHLFKDDVKLISELGAASYRFSISWPRIFSKDSHTINPLGFKYYHDLIDELHSKGIKAAATLYHWDLPQYLEDQGGWNNRETAYAFERYAKACFQELGSKIDMWITHNEPFCAAYLGYEWGIHAPGLKDQQIAYNAVHHLNLSHGLAVETYRKMGLKAPIGTTLNLGFPRPARNTKEDIEAADRAGDKAYYMFMSPLFEKKYPQRHLDALGLTLPIKAGDMDLIGQKIDFLGINYYNEGVVTHDPSQKEGFRGVNAAYTGTYMGADWPIVPLGLYRMLKRVQKDTANIPLYITENGSAWKDELNSDETRCHDPQRMDYLRTHLKACLQAINEGVNLQGYFAWSLLDNYEWAFGYTRRFGIIYVDYNDLRRIPKDSYYYYREIIAGHEDLENSIGLE